MTDHLNVPGAFAYIRLVPDPKAPDEIDSSDKAATALPVESSVDESADALEPGATAKDADKAVVPASALAKVRVMALNHFNHHSTCTISFLFPVTHASHNFSLRARVYISSSLKRPTLPSTLGNKRLTIGASTTTNSIASLTRCVAICNKSNEYLLNSYGI